MNFDIYITNKNTGDTFHYEKALPYADAVRFINEYQDKIDELGVGDSFEFKLKPKRFISYSDAFAFNYQPRR